MAITASEVYFHASQNGQYTIFAKDIEFKKPEDNESQIIPLKEKPENLLFPKDSTTQQFKKRLV